MGREKLSNFAREQDALAASYNRGEITREEYNKQMRERGLSVRAIAKREEAQARLNRDMGWDGW